MASRFLFIVLLLVVVLLASQGSHWRPHGRYADVANNYIDFRYSGNALTNIGAGGGETQITFENDGQRVVLHEMDGNPTLSIQIDGSLCCGPAGLLRKQQ